MAALFPKGRIGAGGDEGENEEESYDDTFSAGNYQETILPGADAVFASGFDVFLEPIWGSQNTIGDVNGDDQVDARDLTALARHVARIETITDTTLLLNADVTGDGDVTSADLTKLARYVARIISEL